MKHLGDITKIDGHNVPLVDIVTGGSPCQDLSVAGKRAGLEGERSGLFMEQIRIVKEMRDESIKQLQLRGADVDIRLIKPRFMVWENVPGAFSSNKGEDFRCVLEEICRIADKTAIVPISRGGKWSTSGCIMGDWWSVAWRLHDAQFWGVPQRRKRIALVADFGGKSAPEILFERESMSGNIEQSKQEREEASRDIRESAHQSAYTLKIRGGAEIDSYGKRAGKGALVQTEKSGTLGVSQDQTLITVGDCYSVDEKMGQTYVHEDQGNTLSARDYKQPQAVVYATQASGDRDNPSQSFQEEKAYTIPSNSMSDRGQAIVYGLCSDGSNSMRSPNPYSGCYEADTTRTLDNNGGNPACNQGGMIIVDKEPMCIQRRFSSVNVSENGISPTLEAGAGEGGNNMPMIAQEKPCVMTYQDKTGTLSPGAHAGSYNGQDAYNDMLVIGGVQNQQQPVKPHFF